MIEEVPTAGVCSLIPSLRQVLDSLWLTAAVFVVSMRSKWHQFVREAYSSRSGPTVKVNSQEQLCQTLSIWFLGSQSFVPLWLSPQTDWRFSRDSAPTESWEPSGETAMFGVSNVNLNMTSNNNILINYNTTILSTKQQFSFVSPDDVELHSEIFILPIFTAEGRWNYYLWLIIRLWKG